MSESNDVDTLEELAGVEKQKTKINKKPTLKVVIKAPPVAEESASEEEDEPETPVTKRVRTPAQIKAFARCLDMKREKAAKRLADAKKLAAFEKSALEEKVVAKAISIKKKQIKKQSALDEISDDDTPIEVVKALGRAQLGGETSAAAKTAKVSAPKPAGSGGSLVNGVHAFTFF